MKKMFNTGVMGAGWGGREAGRQGTDTYAILIAWVGGCSCA